MVGWSVSAATSDFRCPGRMTVGIKPVDAVVCRQMRRVARSAVRRRCEGDATPRSTPTRRMEDEQEEV